MGKNIDKWLTSHAKDREAQARPYTEKLRELREYTSNLTVGSIRVELDPPLEKIDPGKWVIDREGNHFEILRTANRQQWKVDGDQLREQLTQRIRAIDPATLNPRHASDVLKFDNNQPLKYKDESRLTIVVELLPEHREKITELVMRARAAYVACGLDENRGAHTEPRQE